MALTLPLHLFDGVCRWAGLGPSTSLSNREHHRLANFIIADASLFDVIRWRRVSTVFRAAADKRLRSFARIEVRMYNGLSGQWISDSCGYEWHPHAQVMIVEMGPNELGIAIDTKLRTEDVKALIQLLSAFRHSVQQLFMDSPIIELLVSQINRQQVNILIGMLRSSRITIPYHKGCFDKVSSAALMTTPKSRSLPYGPFFPQLKKLTITSQSNQLEHLSRLVSYAVGVDFLYETSCLDLLCLKICMGNYTQWSQKPQYRLLFRHLTKFRQWTEADSLGERYFQQFSGGSSGSNRQKQARR